MDALPEGGSTQALIVAFDEVKTKDDLVIKQLADQVIADVQTEKRLEN